MPGGAATEATMPKFLRGFLTFFLSAVLSTLVLLLVTGALLLGGGALEAAREGRRSGI